MTDQLNNLTTNVEQRFLGMKFSKPSDDYHMGYNDAMDDALRAFSEAVEEVKQQKCNECGGTGSHTRECVFHGQR